MKYDRPLAMIIMTRITKIQTSSCTCTLRIAHRLEDERDQRDAGDAVGLEAIRARPTESPALSPVQSRSRRGCARRLP
jgi:hypothetical protein